MNAELNFTHVSGRRNACKITVYALSTCGFCRRALNFLRENEVEFDYIYVDQLPLNVQDELIAKLEKEFNKHVAFPFLVLDGRECYVGFNPEKYQSILEKIDLKEAFKNA
ncbi:MAG: glutaredoxin family protein [Candidatus Odinarchaeum yellowstonii]|uniref:Glutaredoxin family protein n=1 Tax=Odinarchaeota yellowstonii (strain LCB_4) TaxID=1841599 RepID=A0AAF0D2A6_ODILC|nr:MAG: glutaredoxin family protein [Candidatus Odinarchaeum yellowstonii]